MPRACSGGLWPPQTSRENGDGHGPPLQREIRIGNLELSGTARFTSFPAMNWYYSENGKQVGPLGQAEFDSLIQSGKVTAATLVWRDGLEKWVPYGTLSPSPVAVATAGGTRVCAECGKSFD